MAGRTGIFHHVGTFLLLVATALLLVTTITSPVVNDMSIMRVQLSNRTSAHRSAVSFGTFGYCVLNVKSGSNDDDDWCTGSHIGYDPLAELARGEPTSYNAAQSASVRTLSHVMVLHPIAVALSFIAFLLAIGSGFIGAIFAASVSLLAFLVTVVVLATDITMFSLVRNKVNDMNDGRNVQWGTGFWTLVAGMVVLFIATVVVLATCCSSRLHERRNRRRTVDDKYATHNTTYTKRRFWQRRSRY